MKHYILFFLILLITAPQVEAQFLKKLKKTVENAAERAALEKADKLTRDGTNAAIDSLTQPGSKKSQTANPSNPFGLFGFGQANEGGDSAQDSAFREKFSGMMGGGDMTDIPDEYRFSYRVVMNVEASREELEMIYWLQPGERYVANMPSDPRAKGTNLTVMDIENRAMVMFMEADGRKMAMRMNTSSEVFDEYMSKEIENQSSVETQKITQIESKEILGYTCKGYSIETEEGITKIYLTDETPVGFLGGFISSGQLPQTGVELSENTMFLEMEFLPNKKSKDYFHLVCTEFKEESLVLRKEEYSSMGFDN
ncbi:DUF4412 domain-containing protein [Algoriphagus sp.]|uniref:DUF4412 domain-containing protein n=1 Tax=Algoriphagus sp. TaxID=1872435 RepID=UPI0025F7BA2A|nr:DUF4412 domain-containing protein [Algoriphagus sp.]